VCAGGFGFVALPHLTNAEADKGAIDDARFARILMYSFAA
jgi:hypothetical protein